MYYCKVLQSNKIKSKNKNTRITVESPKDIAKFYSKKALNEYRSRKSTIEMVSKQYCKKIWTT